MDLYYFIIILLYTSNFVLKIQLCQYCRITTKRVGMRQLKTIQTVEI